MGMRERGEGKRELGGGGLGGGGSKERGYNFKLFVVVLFSHVRP